jgi:hypothetical protein
MPNGRRRGGAPWWLRIYAVICAATLLFALMVLYFTTVHVRIAAARFAREAGVLRTVTAVPYADLINRTAAAARLNPALLAAVVATESGFDPRARSSRGAYGLMQVMPGTWRDMGGTADCRVTPAAPPAAPACMEDARANLAIGAAYLRRLVDRFDGNIVLAVAAYNAGAVPVRRYHGVPPFPETIRYMRQVSLVWYQLEYHGTLSRFWFGVIRRFDLWRRLRIPLIVMVVVMFTPWIAPLRRPAAGAIALMAVAR